MPSVNAHSLGQQSVKSVHMMPTCVHEHVAWGDALSPCGTTTSSCVLMLWAWLHFCVFQKSHHPRCRRRLHQVLQSTTIN